MAATQTNKNYVHIGFGSAIPQTHNSRKSRQTHIRPQSRNHQASGSKPGFKAFRRVSPGVTQFGSWQRRPDRIVKKNELTPLPGVGIQNSLSLRLVLRKNYGIILYITII